MAISIVGTPQTANANNGENATITWSTGPSEGDYTVVVIGSPATSAAKGTMVTTGYTELKSYVGANNTKPSLIVFYKKQGATTDTTAVGTSGNGADTDSSMIGFVLRGVDPTTFSDATPTTAGETSSTNPDPASITVGTAGAAVIVAAVMVVTKDTSVTAPSGYTGYSVVGDDTDDHTLAAAYKLNCSGAENPASWTNWDTGLWYAITIAVKPAPEAVQANSTRAIYSKGKTSTSSTRAVYSEGKATSNSTRGVYTMGKSTNAGSSNWYNSSWLYRVKVTALATQVDADLTDFPVYVDLSELPADFHTNVKAAGADIRVTTSDGTTEVPREVVFYDAASDTGELHFKGTVSSSTDTDFYIYYGNSSASDYATNATYGAENVWKSTYKGVWHLNEASGTVYDSTSNSVDSTSETTTNRAVDGAIGKGVDVSGTSDVIGFGDVLDLGTNDMTFQMWIKTSQTPTNYAFSLSKSIAAAQDYRYAGGIYGSTAKARLFFKGSGSTDVDFSGSTTVNDNSWKKIDWVFDRDGNGIIYVGGSSDGSASIAAWDGQDFQSNNPFRIGAYTASDNTDVTFPYNGLIDEVRLSWVVLTPTWISTEHNNQSSPSTFFTIGTQEISSSDAERKIYTIGASGGTQADSERSIYTKGVATSSSERGLYTSGKLSSSSERGIYTEGEAAVENWLTGWDYRVKVTVLASKVDADLTDFPVYVDLSELPEGFHTHVNQTDARDIRVTTDDGETEVPREVVFYTAASDTGELHFKGDIDGDTDTDFYIYYGNSSATEPAVDSTYGRNATWEGYQQVCHLNEAVNNNNDGYVDSSGNGLHLKGNNMEIAASAGQLAGNSQNFDGSNDYLTDDTTSVTSSNASGTVQFWYKNSTTTAKGILTYGALGTTSQIHLVRFNQGGSGTTEFLLKGSSDYFRGTGATYTDGNWHQLVMTGGSGGNAVYQDGGGLSLTYTAGSSSTENWWSSLTSQTGLSFAVGRIGTNTYLACGLDEIRVRNSKLTSTWVSTEYNNQSSPSTFFTIGSQEEPSTGTAANSERLIYSLGEATSSSTRDIYSIGKLTSSSTRDIYTKGVSTSSSERSIYTKGVLASSSEKNIYSEGSVSASSEKAVYSKGSASNNSERAIYSKGIATSSSVRSVYSKATLGGDSERAIYTKGVGTSSSTKNIYTKSNKAESSEKNIYSISNSTGSSTKNIHSIGGGIVNSERAIYTKSALGSDSARSIYSKGIATSSSTKNIYSDGSLTSSSEKLIHSSGKILSSSERGIYSEGQIPEGQGYSERNIYTEGIATSSSTRSVHSKGSTDANSERVVYTEGMVVESSQRSVYTKGTSTGSSERSLHSVGGGSGSSEKEIYTLGGAVGSSQRSIYTKSGTTSSKVKRWNGVAWVDATVKRYNGSAWVDAKLKYYNGSVWEDIN